MGITRIYIGESHRTIWDRMAEQRKDLKGIETKNALVKHWLNEYKGGGPLKFDWKVKKTFQHSLHRQIWEALSIASHPEDHLLNSKTEWG